jgi:hypothetical protein
MDRVASLFAYDPALNYRFLFQCYCALTLLSAFFAALQFGLDVTSVTGFWIVPAPSLLCLPFIAWRWRQQSALEAPAAAAAEAKKKA